MHHDLRRRVDAGRHAHGRPPHAVELQDVLADEVVGGAPPRREVVAVVPVAGHGEVVDERVVPHVEDVAAVPRHGHAPGERRPRDRHVAQAAPDEAQGLVALRDGAHEVGVVLVVVEQALLEGAQFEEVVVLLHLDHRSAVHRALPVHQLVLVVVVLARNAVQARVGPQLNEAVVVNALQELLHHGVVPRLGGPDEVVVGDVECLPRLDEARRGAVGPLLGCGAVRLGRLDDFRPVLVGAGHEAHLVPEQPVPARQGVGIDRRVRRAHVRGVVDVVDRGGQVVVGHRG